MSRFVVDFSEPQKAANPAQASQPSPAPQFGGSSAPKKRSLFARILKYFAVFLLAAALAAIAGGYLYWRSVKKTPQYSIALLVDAARRDDQAEIERIVDSQKVVENFVPQITDKAVELYGRNLPPGALARLAQVAAPLIPSIKDRANAELPRLIREKTAPVESVPYWMIALGADRALEIKTTGDRAEVKSLIPAQPLELTLMRDGDRWKVVAIKDEALARRIAEKIGQEMIAAASKGGLRKAGEQFGVGNLQNLVRELENLKF